MRLSADEIKQGILHPEQIVRDAALRYFAKSFDRNLTVMPLAVQAIETYGWEAAFEFASNLSRLVQTEETFMWVTDRMERIGYPETLQAREECLGLAAIIVKSDVALLTRHHPRVRSLKGLHPQDRLLIAERLRLLGRDAETCWKDLKAWCQRNRRIRHINQADVPAAQRLVNAIARNGQPFAERVMAILSQEVEDDSDSSMAWMECFAAQLAGELRLEAAAPLLAAKLRKDGGDMLNEDCMYSLIKIGMDSAVAAICGQWPSEPEHFKLYGLSSLENIHTDAKVSRCLALYPEETKANFRIGLLQAVLTSFATEGIEPARQLVLNGGWGLDGELIPAAILTGISFPELEQWMADEKADAESRKGRRRQLFAPTPSKAGREFPSIAQLAEPPAPPLVKKEQVGRNDPCPCGSGKKYKRCCMGRG